MKTVRERLSASLKVSVTPSDRQYLDLWADQEQRKTGALIRKLLHDVIVERKAQQNADEPMIAAMSDGVFTSNGS